MVNNLRLNAIKFAKYIVNNQIDVIDWNNIFLSFDFEYITNKGALFNSDSSKYLSTVTDVLYESFNKDKVSALKMVRYLLEECTYLSDSEIQEILNLKNFDYDIKDNSINNLTCNNVFISYSNKDNVLANKLKTILENYGINGFLAHEDIKPSELWRNKIFSELKNADVFIALLSKDYLKSCYCIQETGMALYSNIPIVPISIDNTKSMGFLDMYQSKDLEINDKNILDSLYHSHSEDIINKLIFILENTSGYDNCAHILNILSTYFKEFSDMQITNLVNVAIRNNQIYESINCKPYLKEFYKIHGDALPSSMNSKFIDIL